MVNIQVVVLLAGSNDLELLEKTKEGRNINRHYYTKEEVAQEVQRPVVKNLLDLLAWRNKFAAFDLDGSIEVETPTETTIKVTRKDKDGKNVAVLDADAANKTFTITANGEKVMEQK